MFYSEDIIEQVRTENDIVDVIGDYVKLQKKGSSYLDFVLFTMKSHHLFPYHPITDVLLLCGAEGAT